MPSYYGSAIYGVDTYNSTVPTRLTTLNRLDIYVGTHEENHLFARELTEQEILDLLEFSSKGETITYLATQTISEVSLKTVGDLVTGKKQSWTSDSLMLASYNNTLEAGKLDFGGVEFKNWRIKRRRDNSFTSVFVADFEVADYQYDEVIEYTDKNLWSKRDYIYSLIPLTVDGTEGEILSVVTNITFDGWILTDPNDENNYIKFLYNVDPFTISLEENRKESISFAQYPKVRYGLSDFHRGTLSALFIPEGSTVVQQMEKLKSLLRLRKSLLLKDGRGVNYLVNAFGFNESVEMYYIEPSKAIIQWVEVGEPDA